MTVLIFIARAFIAGGFQVAYVYTPEVKDPVGTQMTVQTREPIAVVGFSAGVSHGDQGFGSGNKQRDGKGRCPDHTICGTGGAVLHLLSSKAPQLKRWCRTSAYRPCLKGDAGVICVPGSVRVLLLLPLRCHRLLRAAHRDDGPGPAGVQPARVGPGNGGPCLVPRFSEDPSFLLGLTGLTSAGIQMTAGQNEGEKKKKARTARLASRAHLQSNPKSLCTSVASKEPDSTVYVVLL